jgi:hypothetical protein
LRPTRCCFCSARRPISGLSNDTAEQIIVRDAAHAIIIIEIEMTTSLLQKEARGTMSRSAKPSPLYKASFFEEQVPAFVEPELERLYENPFSTLARFAIYAAAPRASTYVEQVDDQIVTAVLFRREPRHIVVYNEQVTLEAAAIRRFAQAVFERYPSASRIGFYAILTNAPAIGYPYLQRECLEDIVLSLPASPDAYLAALGKNTRAEIRRYLGKVRQDFPSFRFDVYPGTTVREEHIREIVAFNHARMEGKDQRSYHDEQSIDRMLRMTRRYGRVGVATIDGRTCAGIISFRVGTHVMMPALSHDPRFDDYRLGKLCCYLSVCDAIEQGARAYHFGWGRYEYKFRMLGELKPLYELDLYRSRLHMVRDANHVLARAVVAGWRTLKQRVERAPHGKSAADHLISTAAKAARRVKRALRTGS